MPRRKLVEAGEQLPKSRPASSPEAREKQMISLAMDRVEQRIRDGTASSQELCHFLKLATVQSQLEIENVQLTNELLKAKTEAIQTSQRIEELYSKAISAMQEYKGEKPTND